MSKTKTKKYTKEYILKIKKEAKKLYKYFQNTIFDDKLGRRVEKNKENK